VIGFKRGALTEVVQQGQTGFLVQNADQMARAVGEVHRLRPRVCHAHAQKNFSAQRMFRDYEELYKEVTAKRGLPVRVAA
jgi:glycosyltransferase involved in cell wall biosynthesis